MPIQSRRFRQLQAARKCKQKVLRSTGCNAERSPEIDVHPSQELIDRLDDESEEGSWTVLLPVLPAEAHWEGYTSDLDEEEEDCEFTESEEEDELDENAFSLIMGSSRNSASFEKVKIKYQRVSRVSKRTSQRNVKKKQELVKAAEGCKPLTLGFLVDHISDTENHSSYIDTHLYNHVQISPEELDQAERREAIVALEKKLRSKKVLVVGQNRTRHDAVLAFLKVQESRQAGEKREDLAFTVARCFARGVYFARKIVSWEISWRRERYIESGRHGCYSKTSSWFNDEGVQLAVRDWLSGSKEADLTGYGLAKAIGIYLDSKRAAIAVEASFGPGGNRIRARTARRWLKKLGLIHDTIRKGVYVDGHEREDVVKYRNEQFIPQWKQYRHRFVIFNEDGTWKPPSTLLEGEKPLVLVTHDESTFNANDGKRKLWMKKGQNPIRPKTKGKGIMVSGFLTPGGRLKVPDIIPDSELLRDVMWPLRADGNPIRDSMHYLEYGKDNYWTGEKMVEHTMQIALPIFRYAFPGCQALFAFDNASNHCCYATNALVASKMNRNPGGAQPHMREGFIHSKQRPQTMVFPTNYPVFELRGKAKGIEQVLRERGLWRHKRSDGFAFLLQCPTSYNRPGCNTALPGGCCARAVLAAEKDFFEQKGRLQEEIEASNHLIIFYPKFHWNTVNIH